MRLTMIAAALATAGTALALSAGPASATEPEVCYENLDSSCPEPEPTASSYNLIVGTRFSDTIFGTFRDDARTRSEFLTLIRRT